MKSYALSTTAAILGVASTVQAHAIFQKLSIDGADQGLLTGLRAPSDNNPVQSVSSSDLTCGTSGSTSSDVLPVTAGSTLGALYQHVLGGPQGSNDPDNPIASSHKGPVTAWLAAVDDAASASAQDAAWFKIWEDTLDPSTGIWGVDNLIADGGWVYFDVPSCLADGDYLLRVETLALHSAGSAGGAQFYSSCAQLAISGGSGGASPSTVSIPGVYSENDPSVVINIYGSSGQPDLGGQEYPDHGPAVFTC